MIIVVGCGRTKRPNPTRAGYMYCGAYTWSALRWARSVALPGRIFILSAKYGLIPHDRVIAPYDMTLGHPDAVTVDVVRAQAIDLGVLGERATVAGNAAYVRLAREVWPEALAPFGEAGGTWSQRSAMRSHLGQLTW